MSKTLKRSIDLDTSPRLLKGDLPAATGLPISEIQELVLLGLFPAATCDALVGPSWEKHEVQAFAVEFAKLQGPTPRTSNVGARS